MAPSWRVPERRPKWSLDELDMVYSGKNAMRFNVAPQAGTNSMRNDVPHVLYPAFDEGCDVRLDYREGLRDKLIAAPADVGRDDDVRHPPQWIIRWQRLRGENIE